MMVASIVQVDMDPSFLGMCRLDRLEQGDQASCIDLRDFQYLCLARLQIDRAMNVERLATGCLFDRNRNTLRCPTSGGVDLMRGMLRDELLNDEVFYSLNEAQIVIEQWRKHYNRASQHPPVYVIEAKRLC